MSHFSARPPPLQDFREESTHTLLFLKNVERITVSVWLPGSPAPRPLFDVAVGNASDAVRLHRSVRTSAADGRAWAAAVCTAFHVDVAFRSHDDGDAGEAGGGKLCPAAVQPLPTTVTCEHALLFD